jgi:MFS family permease
LPTSWAFKTQFNIFRRRLALRLAISFTCELSFMLFGYEQGVFSGIVGNENSLSTFGNPNSALEGLIVSIYNLGCFFGCFITFALGQNWGRRSTLWVSMVIIIVCTCAFS